VHPAVHQPHEEVAEQLVTQAGVPSQPQELVCHWKQQHAQRAK
jgi:hypothetical protein